ncbi:hypothetical protein B0H67DRAFT_594538 [Lasiosphaeris hirsuta]|uniref:Uncharacterized protein n=1 Tax=Lasiosphaeris hirsuta TaxID=260670 RepID=A0AA39ZXX3_9PEZI|nr:hypothetical protein B0H67DRAFT_594538 [Lasiosphaeris hirsuta]
MAKTAPNLPSLVLVLALLLQRSLWFGIALFCELGCVSALHSVDWPGCDWLSNVRSAFFFFFFTRNLQCLIIQKLHSTRCAGEAVCDRQPPKMIHPWNESHLQPGQKHKPEAVLTIASVAWLPIAATADLRGKRVLSQCAQTSPYRWCCIDSQTIRAPSSQGPFSSHPAALPPICSHLEPTGSTESIESNWPRRRPHLSVGGL